MLKDFISGIADNSSDDYWYDEGLIWYQEMADGFSDEEWAELSERIGGYPANAQMRCAECLSGSDNRNSLFVILRISKTYDRELFVTCVDSLRNMDLSSLSHNEMARISHKIKEYLADASSLEKTVFKAFLDAVRY